MRMDCNLARGYSVGRKILDRETDAVKQSDLPIIGATRLLGQDDLP